MTSAREYPVKKVELIKENLIFAQEINRLTECYIIRKREKLNCWVSKQIAGVRDEEIGQKNKSAENIGIIG